MWQRAIPASGEVRMLIASLTFDVRADKRAEWVSAVTQVLDTMRWSTGCLGCRLYTECENPNLFMLTSEWDNRGFLEAHLESQEFQILEGTSFLLRSGPALVVDEVVARARIPRRISRGPRMPSQEDEQLPFDDRDPPA
jgi:quinol monooxygenase YgiN